MNSSDNIYLFGIRHHGPGSAHSLLKALQEIHPDIILLEGPSEAEPLLELATHSEMKPPVAWLIYPPEQPEHSVFYPFVHFSPEWQAILYAAQVNIPVRCIDLPQTHQIGLRQAQVEAVSSEPSLSPQASEEDSFGYMDPLTWLAQAAGFSDGERWWEYLVEHRQNSLDVFQGIQEAMTALREALDTTERTSFEKHREALREAWMRKSLRQARKANYKKIAVVCGAWHVPALARSVPVKEDDVLLKGLPKCKVEATWVPWTYERLTVRSGYGAGILSPGWYRHLWDCQSTEKQDNAFARRVASSWLSKVALLLRQKGLDTSTASVIESVRMAEALATLRNKPLPDLQEMNEAVLSTFFFGDEAPLRLIHDELIVGNCLGEVPDSTPMVPLQQDLAKLQKRLRLKPSADHTDIELDLREALGLERSQLLYRLLLLAIPWGKKQSVGAGKGTFKENWRLQWQPEFSIRLIEASIWGVTVEEAATHIAKHDVEQAQQLAVLTELVNKILLADLTAALETAMQKLQAEAAVASDVSQLMEGLPALVKTLQYSQQGVVKRFDSTLVAQVVEGFIVRICIGLVNACSSLDDNAANEMSERLIYTKEALLSLNNNDYMVLWNDTLLKLLRCQTLHSLVLGRCCRLLLDGQALTVEEVAQQMIFALSGEASFASAWLEGFLRGKAEILLHDDHIWHLLDSWVCELKTEIFAEILPLLRRTFATFGSHQRRQMGERVKNQQAAVVTVSNKLGDFDEATALKALPLIANLLGLPR